MKRKNINDEGDGFSSKKQKCAQEKRLMNINQNSSDCTNKNEEGYSAVPRRGLRHSVCILDCELWTWYCSKENVSKNLVQARARYIFQKAGITDFKASDGWYRRWIKRWKQYSKENNISRSEFSLSDSKLDCIQQNSNSSDPFNFVKEFEDRGFDILSSLSLASFASHSSLSENVNEGNLDVIVTPSLGDTLESTVSGLHLNIERCVSSATPNYSMTEFYKEDTRLCTPQHDHLENYSDLSKLLSFNISSKTDDVPESDKAVDLPTHEESCSTDKTEQEENIKESVVKPPTEEQKGKPSHVGKRYLPQFKEKVLSYLKSHTFKETAQKFGVHQGSITSWRKDKLRRKLTDIVASPDDFGLDISPAPTDVQFLSWLRRERGHELTAEQVLATAERLVALAGGLPVVERQVRWFAHWVSRLRDKPYEEGMEDTVGVNGVNQRIQYPIAFRMEVAAYAEKNSQMSASRVFSVSRKRVFDWLKAYKEKIAKGLPEDNMLTITGTHRPGSGRSVTDIDVDHQIWKWYCTQQDNGGKKPSGHEVRAYAAKLYAEKGLESQIRCSYGWYRRWCERFGVQLRHAGDNQLLAWTLEQLDKNRALTHSDLQEKARQLWKGKQPAFKASPGWAIRFCKRHPKLLQAVPSVSTPLPEPLRPAVDDFRNTIRNLVKTHNLSTSLIGNLDELPLGFSSPVVAGAKRQLLLRRPGMDTCHASIVLCCLADGTLLSTLLILKDITDVNDVDPNLLVLQQDSGYMDEECMQKWLDHVWFRHVPSPNMLIADCFDPHCGPDVKRRFVEHNSSLNIIPGGCNSKLQPLDICVKSTFQKFIDKRWERLNSGPGQGWVIGQHLRLPSAQELVNWVAEAHRYVQSSQQEIIRRSFLVTGLLIADNHSEDHFIENVAALPNEELPVI